MDIIDCKGTTKNAHTQESEQKQQELFNMATLSQFSGGAKPLLFRGRRKAPIGRRGAAIGDGQGHTNKSLRFDTSTHN
jgi:hypothetical protein